MPKDTATPFGLPQPPAGWLRKPAGISLCMIVKDEERFLERCLRSVAGAVDEINVVDTGSTDDTVEIARRFGARIEHHAWQNDFADARNRSLEMATRRWILQLDADEELTSDSIPHLHQLKRAPAHLTAVLVRCTNLSDRNGAGGAVSHAITRIFPNTPHIRFRGRIHEFPAVDGSPAAIAAVASPIKIVHYGYLNAVIADRDKFARNTRMIEECVALEPEEPYNWYNLGMTAHVGGDQSRAAEALERMWDLCLRHGVRIFAGSGLQMLSSIYTEHLGDPERGLRFAQACLKIAPRYANAHFAAGKALVALKRYEEAREMYRAAIADRAHLARQYVVDEDACGWKPACEIAFTYVAEGDGERALEWFRKALAERFDARPARTGYAAALEQAGRLPEARDAYESLHRDFQDEQSALGLINFLLRHDAAAALDAIAAEHHTLSAPSAVAALQAALHLCISSRDFARAAQLAKTGLHYAPDDDALLYDAAIAAANLGDPQGAFGHLAQIRADAATYERALYLRAVLERELGRFDESLRALESLMKKTGPHVDALLLRASVLERSGRKSDAEQAFAHAVSLEKKRASIELAAFYLREGRPADAKRIAEEALATP